MRVRIRGERPYVWVGIRWKEQEKQSLEESDFNYDAEYKRLETDDVSSR